MKHKILHRAVVAGIVAAVGVTAAMAAGVSGAASEADGAARPVRHLISDLTDEQRQCLRDAGLTKPPADASDDERFAAREAFLAALEDCGIELPERTGPFADLTDEQRQCLHDAGLTRPGADATAEERKAALEALRAAAEGCGIELPERTGPFADITDEQKACLDAAGLARPGAEATPEERRAALEALAAAAEECGIDLPARPHGRPGPLADLTDEQKECLSAAGLARPGADATPEERQAAREALAAAAEECGIDLPTRG